MSIPEKIRARCIEANPLIATESFVFSTADNSRVPVPRPIRLADVLIAMDYYPEGGFSPDNRTISSDGMAIDRAGRFFNWLKNDEHRPYWNLHKDDLESQSDDTLIFISQVLGV